MLIETRTKTIWFANANFEAGVFYPEARLARAIP
jgi:hypothetical protein